MRRDFPAVDHAVQMCSRIFDVDVPVLSGAAFGSKYAAAVDLFEICIGKLVVSFGILRTFRHCFPDTFCASAKLRGRRNSLFSCSSSPGGRRSLHAWRSLRQIALRRSATWRGQIPRRLSITAISNLHSGWDLSDPASTRATSAPHARLDVRLRPQRANILRKLVNHVESFARSNMVLQHLENRARRLLGLDRRGCEIC